MQREEEGFKSKSSGAAAGGLGSSIIGNSGMMFHAGGITQCSSTDQTWFCYLSRLVGMISYIIFLIAMVYLIYIFVWPWITKRLGFRGAGGGRRK
jgi:hypothetical protein